MTGLREAHAHVGQLGETLAMADLARARSVDDVLDLLRTHAEATPEGEWVLGHGLRVEGFDDPAWPVAADLDRALPDRPCAAMSFDHHSLVVNTLALREADITRDTPDIEGGLIERDEQGRPTGVLFEAAAKHAWSAMPAPGPEQRRRHALAGLEALAALGFEEIDDLLTGPDLLAALVALDQDGSLERLGVRVRAYVPARDILDTRLPAPDADRLRVAGVKVFVDGTLNSRTAWMLQPFEEGRPDHPRGMALMSPESIRRTIESCDRLGLPLAAHAIGDAGVRAVLDAIDDVRPRTRGHRIEHAEIVDEADVPRFAALGVVCSPQPCHLLADIEALRRYLPRRLDRVLPLRDLIDAGCTPGELLIFGSDVPIVRADPQDSIDAATLRRRPGMTPDARIAPDQAITEAEAWACFASARSS